jgi:RimJ/RimL family protein N-acetyltransferase
MKYHQEIILKNGARAYLRNGDASDGPAVYENFNLTHAETDYLLSYPDENSFDPEQEARFLKEKTESPNEIEIIALVDGKVAGTAGIEAVGHKYKVKHRAEFGISVLREYWGIGVGKALTKACIQCARDAGYVQLELNVVAGNERAISMYREMGFEEFGRNPRDFNSRESGFQELVYMLLWL